VRIALADAQVGIATPLETYVRRGAELDAQYFQALAAREGITRFVLGLPVHLDGRESQKSAEARSFGAWLEATTGLPVTLFDERFSSREAEQALIEAGLSARQRKARIDKVAAQILLQAYLESECPDEPPAAIDD